MDPFPYVRPPHMLHNIPVCRTQLAVWLLLLLLLLLLLQRAASHHHRHWRQSPETTSAGILYGIRYNGKSGSSRIAQHTAYWRGFVLTICRSTPSVQHYNSIIASYRRRITCHRGVYRHFKPLLSKTRNAVYRPKYSSQERLLVSWCIRFFSTNSFGSPTLFHKVCGTSKTDRGRRIRLTSNWGEPQPTSASRPTSPLSDINPDIFDLLFDISEPLPQPPPGVTWVNSSVSARKWRSHRLFTLTTSQQQFEVHVQLYNTSDIEGLPESEKPFHTAAFACLHLPATSPVLKISDALFITAAEEILSDGGHCFTTDY